MDGCFTTFASNRRKPEIHPLLEPVSPGLVVCILFGSFVLISFVCSFFLGTTALLISALVVLLILMVAGEDPATRYPSISALVSIGVFSSGMAVFFGANNYHANYAPFQVAKAGRNYRNVAADAPASAYLDAGTIHFNESFLDDMHALGWKGHDYTYCVAPIAKNHAMLPGNEPLPGVQFWAVGLDCCAARGVFDCDGAGDFQAQGGVVLHDHDAVVSEILSPRSYHESYMKAVAAACALYEIDSAETPVLLHWVSNTDAFLDAHWRWAVETFIICSAMQFVVVFLLWSIIHGYYDGRVRKAVGMDYSVPLRGRATSAQDPGGRRDSASSLVRPKQDPFLLP